MNTFLKIGMAATAMLAATSVQAATFTFDTTKAGTVVDNAMTYSLGHGAQALTMKATAWNLSEATQNYWFWTVGLGYDVVGKSQLVSYNQGLGVVSGGDSVNDSTHTIDNQGATDFILLQFSEAVSLKSVALNAFSVGQSQTDADATIKWGTLSGGLSNSLSTLAGSRDSALAGYFAGSVESGGASSGTRLLDLGGATGNLWLVGASQSNLDCLYDGFKLAGLTVSTVAAVPEPATWAMMLVGFGMVGAATRYRRRRTAAVYA